MANVLHSTLTGADLHESKGAASASSGQVAIATGAGTAVFASLNWNQLVGRPVLGTASTFDIVPIANGGTGNTTGLAVTSTALATARAIRTNLASTSTASFDGTADVNPGVTGTLPITNGGTGAITASGALLAIGAKANAGVVDGSNAAAGVVGEVLTATTSATANTTLTAVNATSISLTAGDWDVDGVVRFNSTSAPYTVIVVGLGTTSATQPSFPNSVQLNIAATSTTQQMTSPTVRINITSTTTVYLVALSGFASGTSTVDGFISARRVR